MNAPGIVSFSSRINPRFSVLIVYKEALNYAIVREKLTELDNSVGAILVGANVIIMDGERIQEEGLNDFHLLAIEAHEIAHDMLGHEGERNQTHEDEADELGIKILDSLKRKEAADLLRERMKSSR